MDKHDKHKKGLNCAECRRSKLKCDRKVPCSSCVKRGCANICPDGMQAATKGMKLIAVQEENATLKERIQLLEQAMRALRGTQCFVGDYDDDPIQSGSPNANGSDSKDGDSDDADTLDAFGTLTLGEGGGSVYHGQVAQTEYLLKNKVGPLDIVPDAGNNTDLSLLTKDFSTPFTVQPESKTPSNLPPDILKLSDCFPFGPHTPPSPSLKEKLFSYVPSASMTWHLFELFRNGTSVLYEPVTRQEFADQIVAHIYPTSELQLESSDLHPHRLSLLFIICALATLCDPAISDPLPAAEEWHHLAKTAMALHPVSEEPTIMGVQTVFLMVTYNNVWDRNGSEKRWMLMGLVSKMVVSIGLHRDSDRWKLDPVEVQRRRWIFWDIWCYDVWMSFVYGRPPSLSVKHIDCKLPEFPTPEVDKDGEPYPSIESFKFRYGPILSCVSEAYGSPKCTYMQLLRMDRAIRKCPMPPALRIQGLGGGVTDSKWATPILPGLRRYSALVLRESNLLLLHRAHFAQAMDEKRTDILHTRFTPSVLAVYRSSCLLIAGLRGVAALYPEAVRRVWWFWTAPYTAGVVLASLTIRCPKCNLGQAAIPVLDGLVQLFADVKPMFPPTNAFEVLQKLQTASHNSYERWLNSPGSQQFPDELELELPLLDGRTRLVSRSHTARSSTDGSSPSTPARAQSAEFMSAFGNVHPSVLEYFKVLDGPSPQSQSDESNASPSAPILTTFDQSLAEVSSLWDGRWQMTYSSDGITPVSNGPPDQAVDPFYMDLTAQPSAQQDPLSGQYFFPKSGTQVQNIFPPEPNSFHTFGGDDVAWTTLLDQLGIPNAVPAMSNTGM